MLSALNGQHILLGLLGQSLGHSLSPIIHQAFFDELGLSGRYDKIEVADATDVPARLSQLADEGYSGLNVTIPYKLTVLPCLAGLDQSAELAGAVNTIRFEPEPTGFNTDVSGLAEALSKLDLDEAALSNLPAKALVLGSGGAARAAIIALSSLGFKQLEICSRSRENAQSMLDQLLKTAERASLVRNCQEAQIMAFDDLSSTDSIDSLEKGFGQSVSVVINATPIGQKSDHIPDALGLFLASIAAKSKSQHSVFVDLVYSKNQTPLCKMAQAVGFTRVEDGKEMLINQARLAFKIWTGHLPDGQLARERLV